MNLKRLKEIQSEWKNIRIELDKHKYDDEQLKEKLKWTKNIITSAIQLLDETIKNKKYRKWDEIEGYINRINSAIKEATEPFKKLY